MILENIFLLINKNHFSLYNVKMLNHSSKFKIYQYATIKGLRVYDSNGSNSSNGDTSLQVGDFYINLLNENKQLEEQPQEQELYDEFIKRYPEIDYYNNCFENTQAFNYIDWGIQYVNPKIEYNNIQYYFEVLQKENVLFYDTEGFPRINMLQISSLKTDTIYVYTNKKVIDDFTYYVLPNNNIQKIVWSLKEEKKRTDYVESDIQNVFDLQPYFNNMGLKRVCGLIYRIKLEIPNRKYFYNQDWSRPNKRQIIYGALDIFAMKQCLSLSIHIGYLEFGMYGNLVHFN